MNILILNWRDPRNPKSGGAEKLNVQILKPLVERGDRVTWYAMESKGLPREERIDGVYIVRYGNAITHFLVLPYFLILRKFGKIDLVIDSIHGIGYLSSLIAPRTRKIILICEVAQEIWDEMYPLPINIIGKTWEKIMFRFYQGQKFWTISESTKKDLINFGIKKKMITVLPMGFDGLILKKIPNKYDSPTVLFVGRLAQMKGVEDAIHAIATLNREGYTWRLIVIGRGEKGYERSLKNMTKKLGVVGEIIFKGYITEKEKFEEMAKSWVLLAPSSREGWGMIVPEANSVGTPVIAYDVSGLRDVVARYSKKNILVNKNSAAIVEVLQKMKRYQVVKEKIQPGWADLNRFISQRV